MFRAYRCWAAAGATLFMTAGCDFAPEPPEAPPAFAEMPKELCAQAAESLSKAGRSGGFENDGRGGATIQQEAWIAMGPSGQENLTKILAVDAACRAETVPREQQVSVRNEEGRSLSNRIVEIAPDTKFLFEEE